jgi:cytidylate kinase
MYRAVTLVALERGIPPTDTLTVSELAAGLEMEVEASSETRVAVEGRDVTGELRRPDVEAAVSDYSAIPAVRRAMVRRQRGIAARAPTVVAGRDIGTVVLPEAPLKFYLDATADTREGRRERQARESGQHPPAEARRHVGGRDEIDSSRIASPLRAAADAVVIDTSRLTLDEVLEIALRKVREGR